MPGRIADLLAQSGAAGLATAPVLASGFGQISTVGLVANLVAVPVAGPVVVVALLGTVAHSVWGPAGVGLAWIAAMGAGIVMGVARVTAAIPGAVVAVPGWGVVPLALVAASPVLVWAWLRRVPQMAVGPGWGMPGRDHWMRVGRIGLTGVVMIATAGLPGWTGSGALPGGPALRVLDIGQGSAAVLRDGARADVLVDCGPPGEPPPVIDALARAGIDSVGVIIISHGALDHAGGAIAVIDAMPVGRVLLPDPDHDAPLVREVAAHAMARGVPVTWASAGSEISIGPWSARVIGPGRDDARSAEANDRSLVVLARAPGLSALLPGDAEGNVLRDLSLPPTPVLVVSHHGSEDPAIPPVLARLRPVVAVVSSGAGNNYGHPRAQVLTALADAGAGVLRTDSGGDVDIRAGQGGIVVRRG
jgi:competence protein ComEC